MSGLDELLEYLRDWVVPRLKEQRHVVDPLWEGMQKAAAENAALRAEVERLKAERDGLQGLLADVHRVMASNDFTLDEYKALQGQVAAALGRE